MPLMLSKLYAALLEAGASDDSARAAAEEAAAYEQRLNNIESKVDRLDTKMTFLQWTVGLGFSFVLALLLVNLNWTWQIMQRLPH